MATFTSSVSNPVVSKRPQGAAQTRPRDVYSYWLEQSRAFSPDESKTRLLWFETVPLHHKTQALFELEGMLKGIACLSTIPRWAEHQQLNPSSISSRTLLYVMQQSIEYALHRVTELIGSDDPAQAFRAVQVGSHADWRHQPYSLFESSSAQRTPEESLDRLHDSLRHSHVLCTRWLEQKEIPYDAWTSTHSMLVQHVQQNRYFNSLYVLDFRAELDRIRTPPVLELLEEVRFVGLHRVLVLMFLWKSRVERYLDWATESLFKQVEAQRQREGWHPLETASLVYPIWAYVYADTVAYCRWSEHYLRNVMHHEIQHELLQLPMEQTLTHYEQLRSQVRTLPGLSMAFESWLRRATAEIEEGSYHLYQTLPNYQGALTAGQQDAARNVLSSLQHLVHHGTDSLLSVVAPRRSVVTPRNETEARIERSERLRQEAWMFAQVLRAFVEHAKLVKGTPAEWETQTSLRFVSEFLDHFRALGYQLLRMSDYQRIDPFLKAIDRLREFDVLEPTQIQYVTEECESLRSFLLGLVDHVSSRAELRNRSFDKRKAAAILRAHVQQA